MFFYMTKIIPEYIKTHLVLDDLTSSLPLLRFIDGEKQVTQADAAADVGLARGTCNLHFQKLEHMGLIRRASSLQPKGRGRSTIVWESARNNNFYILMIFAPPFFEGSLVDFSGKTLFHQKQDLTHIPNRTKLLKEVQHFFNAALVESQKIGGTVRLSFVGTSGFINSTDKTIISVYNLPALNGINFPQWIQKQYGLPCICDSIGQPLYYGEAQSIPGKILTMVVLWDLGLGIIAGEGPQIISQASNTLISNIGHIRIQRGGRACHCGKKGCLEAYTGGWAMIEMLKDPEIQTLEDFTAAVLSGHVKAIQAARTAAKIIGQNLCLPLQMMQTERLIIGGPLSVLFPVVRDSLIEGLSAVFEKKEISALNPTASQNHEQALQTGAYLCAHRQFLYPDS